jgi:hypothetical protein
MYRRVARVQLAAAFGLVLLTSAAHAQRVDPRCARAGDKIGCTCAVQNGGYIDANGRWYANRGRRSAPNDAFVQCQIRAGRR